MKINKKSSEITSIETLVIYLKRSLEIELLVEDKAKASRNRFSKNENHFTWTEIGWILLFFICFLSSLILEVYKKQLLNFEKWKVTTVYTRVHRITFLCIIFQNKLLRPTHNIRNIMSLRGKWRHTLRMFSRYCQW